MRLLILFSCLLFLFSCEKVETKTGKPTFLIGDWKRLNDKPGSQTYEMWNSNLVGMAYTLKNGKKSFSEVMTILTQNDSLFLEVKVIAEKPVLFYFTEQTDTSFVCENPENEFPKTITYFKDGEQLKAIVASDDFRIDFIFENTKLNDK